MSSRIVEGVVLEHPDHFDLLFEFFDSAEYAQGFLDGCANYGEWTGDLLSVTNPGEFLKYWPDDEDGETFKSDAIKQIEEAKSRLDHG